jgi:hypothetical protein
MKRYLIIFFASISLAFSAQGVFSPVKTLPCPNNDINPYIYTYITKNQTVFMTWTDGSGGGTGAWYAIYNLNNSFSKGPEQLNFGDGDVDTVYIEKNNTIFLGFLEDFSNKLYFQYYDCAKNEFIGKKVEILSDVDQYEVVYMTKENAIYINFIDSKNNNLYYVIFDCNTNKLTTEKTLIQESFNTWEIPLGVFNPYNNTIFLTSTDNLDNPYFSVFDCNTLSFSTPFTLFDPSYTQGAAGPLQGVINNHQIFICWTDTQDSVGLWYAIYDFSQNSIIKQPTQFISSSSLISQQGVTPLLYPLNNTVFLNWTEGINNTYAIYNPIKGDFSESAPFSTLTNTNDNTPIPILILKDSAILFSWFGFGDKQFHFQTYAVKNAILRKLLLENSNVFFQKGAN